jgi:hypothetical protein
VPEPSVVVAALIIDPSIEGKINTKHQLTATEVREAVIYSKDASAEWQDSPEHGTRLVVRGTTYLDRPVIAYLAPLNENDPEEGTFRLKTAMSDPNWGSTT